MERKRAGATGVLHRGVRPRTVLLLDLTEPLRERGDDPVSAVLARGRPTLRDIVAILERAAGDRRVVGLFARLRTPAAGLADVQELRDAVAAFRATGRFAIAHAETFGEFSSGNAPYYLACAFDEIWLQPSGDVGLVGVASEVDFLRGALDKLGIVPQLDARHEYKNAKNLFTETGFTPEHREATQGIVAGTFDQLVRGVAERRGLDEAVVRALVDRAPLLGAEAVDAGLVDHLGYRDQALEAVRSRAGDGASLLPIDGYRRHGGGARPRSAPTLAVINATGAISQGRSRTVPLRGSSVGSDTLTLALRQAREDRRVRAVLLRVDSPGGSYVASDAIWREVVRTREAGVPVVVSMGNVAGSGGYFIAMAADRIVAHPGTITGSIGVVAGKAVIAGFKRKLGVTTDAVAAGANALVASSSREYSPGQWERLEFWLDHVYEDFTSKVARGRGLPPGRVDEIARGRVWTGADALGLGLVDALGGYPEALRQVRDVAGLSRHMPMREKVFPPARTIVARATRRRPEDPDERGGVGLGLGPDMGLGGLLDAGVLRMPGVPLRW